MILKMFCLDSSEDTITKVSILTAEPGADVTTTRPNLITQQTTERKNAQRTHEGPEIVRTTIGINAGSYRKLHKSKLVLTFIGFESANTHHIVKID